MIEPGQNQSEEGERPHLGFFTKVIIGALAVFGAITLVGWVINAIFGTLKFFLFVVVVVALIGGFLSLKRRASAKSED